MKYMLLIYEDETKVQNMSQEELGPWMAKWFAFDSEARAATNVLDGNPLQPTATSTTVRLGGGKTVVSDGPFAETKEQLGGYYMIDAASLDEATAIAGKMPNLELGGCVEVRPIMEIPQQ